MVLNDPSEIAVKLITVFIEDLLKCPIAPPEDPRPDGNFPVISLSHGKRIKLLLKQTYDFDCHAPLEWKEGHLISPLVPAGSSKKVKTSNLKISISQHPAINISLPELVFCVAFGGNELAEASAGSSVESTCGEPRCVAPECLRVFSNKEKKEHYADGAKDPREEVARLEKLLEAAKLKRDALQLNDIEATSVPDEPSTSKGPSEKNKEKKAHWE